MPAIVIAPNIGHFIHVIFVGQKKGQGHSIHSCTITCFVLLLFFAPANGKFMAKKIRDFSANFVKQQQQKPKKNSENDNSKETRPNPYSTKPIPKISTPSKILFITCTFVMADPVSSDVAKKVAHAIIALPRQGYICIHFFPFVWIVPCLALAR